MYQKLSYTASLLLVFLGSSMVYGQTNEVVQQLTNETIILNESGIIRGDDAIRTFLDASDLHKKSYQKKFSIEVNANLAYEIGELRSPSETSSVMFVKQQGGTSPKIEFLVIYKKDNPADNAKGIDAGRKSWMELCNAHRAAELVKQLYTADAYYYNRGRLLQGTEAISAEYGYMNSPSYSLTLTPKHVVFVTESIAYEIGQCSGSYPLPYMLLWEKQKDGNWQVRMDSNF